MAALRQDTVSCICSPACWLCLLRAQSQSLLLQVAIELEVSMLGKVGADGTPLRERSEDLQVGWIIFH